MIHQFVPVIDAFSKGSGQDCLPHLLQKLHLFLVAPHRRVRRVLLIHIGQEIVPDGRLRQGGNRKIAFRRFRILGVYDLDSLHGIRAGCFQEAVHFFAVGIQLLDAFKQCFRVAAFDLFSKAGQSRILSQTFHLRIQRVFIDFIAPECRLISQIPVGHGLQNTVFSRINEELVLNRNVAGLLQVDRAFKHAGGMLVLTEGIAPVLLLRNGQGSRLLRCHDLRIIPQRIVDVIRPCF